LDLDTNGVGDLRFVAPDLGYGGTNWLPQIMSDPVIMAKLAYFGEHSYLADGGNSAGVYDFLQQSAYPDRHFWMTEFNVWCSDCENCVGGATGWTYFRGTAEYLLAHLANGASGGLVWEGYDSFYMIHNCWSYWGLFAVDDINAVPKTYTPRKNFYTVAQISKFVRPGAQRINVSGSTSPFVLLAFYQPNTGQLALTGENTDSSPATLSGTLTNLPSISSLDLYYTSSTTNLAYDATFPVTNGVFTATVPADCIFTFSGFTVTQFGDTTPPTLAITAPTPGQLWSNAVFTVTGTASDNVAVSNVLYSLNNAVWTNAATANNWTNWTAGVTLLPGTNTIAAYAVDTSGNISTTNSVSFVAVLSTVLTVNTNGNGTVNPNYNGVLLQIGNNYSMTATAGAGFAFTNWTGSLTTNNATLMFTMASNLTFTANFMDVQKPTNSITSPKPGQLWSNAVFTVTGTASDNVAVSNVLYSLNNAAWRNAATANNWANWTAVVNLIAGTNTIQTYAVDTSGNISATNSVSFVAVLSTVLTVHTNGLGSLNPNYNNALLQIGKSYSITATPGSGFMFTNWTGGTTLPLAVLTNGATLQFVMQSNLVLQANFAGTNKPTVSITDLATGQRVSSAEFTVKGKASDSWQVSNVVCQINGGGWNSATNINNWTNWAAGVTFIPGTNVVQACAVDTSGNVSTTNSVSIQFVVTNQLQIHASGLGTISPNYSNAWLEIGRNYSTTATAATNGFVFTNWVVSTNWIGGTIITKTNLLFMMASNLTLQVNFADVARPINRIIAPTPGQHMTNTLATVVGTAIDNWKVAGVWYQLNNGAWNPTTTTNGWTNWTTTVELSSGTNTVKAYAMDFAGNFSTTNSVSFVSSNAFKLQLAFTNALPLKSNGLVFSLELSIGLNGHIQVSTNLKSWTTLTNFVGTNSTITFRDPAATNSNHRFYRAVIP
jgi:hypothetical protein